MTYPINAITEFRKEYWFLSNYFNAPIRINGLVFPTNEHAFAAFKTTDLSMRAAIARLPTPGDAKKRGRQLALRPDWEEIKYDVMRHLVHQKFKQYPNLAMNLIETGSRWLIEGNTWKDTTWGVDLASGNGDNHLGAILMEERSQIRTRIYDAASVFAATQREPADFESACIAGDEALLHGVADTLGIQIAQRFFNNPARLRDYVFQEELAPQIIARSF